MIYDMLESDLYECEAIIYEIDSEEEEIEQMMIDCDMSEDEAMEVVKSTNHENSLVKFHTGLVLCVR